MRGITSYIAVAGLLVLSSNSLAVPFELGEDNESRTETADIGATHAYNKGIVALQQSDWETAETAFREAREIAPDALEPLLGLAEVAQLSGDSQQAAQWIREALNAAPGDQRARSAWAKWLYVDRQYDNALTEFESLLEQNPDHAGLLLNIADTLMAANRPADAETRYRLAVAALPKHAGSHYGLGQSLLAQNKIDEAIAAYDQSVGLDNENPLPRIARARAHILSRRPQLALDDFDEILAVNPELLQARLGKAHALIELNEEANAREILEGVIEHEPDNPMANRFLAILYESAKEPKNALRAYHVVASANPLDTEARLNAARLSLTMGKDIEKAASLLQDVLAVAPESSQAREMLAQAYVRNGEFEKGLELAKLIGAETVYRKQPNSISNDFAYGTFLLTQRRDIEAMDRFQAVVDASEGGAITNLAKGHLALRKGQFNDAVSAFEQGIAATNPSAVTLSSYSDALFGVKEFERALTAIERALAADPNDIDIRFKHAVLQQVTERYGAAISAYLDIADNDPDRAALSYNNMAWMSAELSQNLDQAVSWAKRAVELNPQAPAYFDTLGWVYFRKGDLENARDAFDRALTIDADYEAAKAHKAMVEELAAEATEETTTPDAG